PAQHLRAGRVVPLDARAVVQQPDAFAQPPHHAVRVRADAGLRAAQRGLPPQQRAAVAPPRLLGQRGAAHAYHEQLAALDQRDVRRLRQQPAAVPDAALQPEDVLETVAERYQAPAVAVLADLPEPQQPRVVGEAPGVGHAGGLVPTRETAAAEQAA